MKFGVEVHYKMFSNKYEYREFRLSENSSFKGANELLQGISIVVDRIG